MWRSHSCQLLVWLFWLPPPQRSNSTLQLSMGMWDLCARTHTHTHAYTHTVNKVHIINAVFRHVGSYNIFISFPFVMIGLPTCNLSLLTTFCPLGVTKAAHYPVILSQNRQSLRAVQCRNCFFLFGCTGGSLLTPALCHDNFLCRPAAALSS